MKKNYTWDIETLINCFTVTFLDADPASDEYFQFVIHDLRNDIHKINKFLHEKVKGLIGFNSLNFDSPVTEAVLQESVVHRTGNYYAYVAYSAAQEIITSEFRDRRKKLGIEELDLFLLHHFNNPAKSTSLKWIECYFNMTSIEEMPHPHDKPVWTLEQIESILKYNLNDCRATKLLYLDSKTQDLVKIRQWAVTHFAEPRILNMSNSSMGEYIFQHQLLLGGEINKPFPPRKFYLKEIILPYVKFKTPVFDEVLMKIKDTQVTGIGDSLGVTCTVNGLEYQFGLGGLHAARENSTSHSIHSVDVQSYYPRLAILNRFHPRHLSQDQFVDTYDYIFTKRLETAKGSAMNKAYKETLNSAFGKSNSEYSFLYDPQFMYSITINGQLLLAMLCEKIEMECGRIIMANTDGIEVEVRDQEKFTKICRQWQKLTGLVLEESFYQKIMIRDVNNYIALKYEGGKHSIKTKGAYEHEKEFHKDQSMKAVPLTVAWWFTDRGSFPSVEAFIRSRPLNEFFMYGRAKTGRFLALTKDGRRVEVPRTIRYVITKKGYTLTRATDKKIDKIHKDAYVSIMNDMSDPDPSEEQLLAMIDYNWYAREVYKLIIKDKSPTTMF